MTSRLITPQLAEQFKQYPLYSQDGKKLNARNINIIKKIENEHDKAIAYHDTVAPKMEEIRYQIDKLELTVADELWTLPKYRELLFIR